MDEQQPERTVPPAGLALAESAPESAPSSPTHVPLPQWMPPPMGGPEGIEAPGGAGVGRRGGEPDGVMAPVPLGVIENLLGANPFLQSCRKTDLTELAALTRAFECAAGALLLDANATGNGLGLLITGVANAMGLDPNGFSAVEAMRAPDVFGENLLLGVQQHVLYGVVAQTDCRVLWLPTEAVQRLFERSPRLGPLLAQRLARRFAVPGNTGATPSQPAMPALMMPALTPPPGAPLGGPSATRTPSVVGQAFPSLPPVSMGAGSLGAGPFGPPPSTVSTVPSMPAVTFPLSPAPAGPALQSPINPPLIAYQPHAEPVHAERLDDLEPFVPWDAMSPTLPPLPPSFPGAKATYGSASPNLGTPLQAGPAPVPPPSAFAAPPSAFAPPPSAFAQQPQGMFAPVQPMAAVPAAAAPGLSAPAPVGLWAPAAPVAVPAPPTAAVPASKQPLTGRGAAARRVEVAIPRDIRYVEVGDYELSAPLLGLIPPKLIRQHRLLPLELTGTRLTVGLVSPRNPAALAELQRTLQSLELDVVAISADDYFQAIVRHRLNDDPKAAGGDARRPSINPDSLQYETAETDREPANQPKISGDEIVRLVNRIIVAALEREASDIHFEPVSTGIRVRFRVHGALQDGTEHVPLQLARPVQARVKIMAGLDITERRRPQDGRIGVKAGRKEIDLRVSTLPCARGEKLVMRVLDGAMATRPLGQVFLEARVLEMARHALNRPYGGIIVAGATGAGKTSTLYAMMNERRLTRPDTHVTMVEEPIEYRIEGVTQVQVDASANLGFAQALRSMLRQDPDVIVVGEMRDPETARVGLEAAMTGHVLLTSLHANTALSAVQRLEELQCSRPLISLSLALVLVQRLVRRLCSACRRQVEVPQALIDSLVMQGILGPGAPRLLYGPVGCDSCGKSGFVGRAAVFEAMQLNDELRELLASSAPMAEVEKVAVETGCLVPFASYASHLVRQGIISGSEALLTVAD